MPANLNKRLAVLEKDPRLEQDRLYGTAYTILDREFTKGDWEKIIYMELKQYGRTPPEYVQNAFLEESEESFLERIQRKVDEIIARLLRTPLTEWPENKHKTDHSEEHAQRVMDEVESNPNSAEWLVNSFKPGGENETIGIKTGGY